MNQLELTGVPRKRVLLDSVPERKRVAAYDDPPGSEPRSVEVYDLDFAIRVHEAMTVIDAASNAASEFIDHAVRGVPTPKPAAKAGTWDSQPAAETVVIDGVTYELTWWLSGKANLPAADGWYEIYLAGESANYSVMAHYTESTKVFRVLSTSGGLLSAHYISFVWFRGLTTPVREAPRRQRVRI